MSDIVGVVYEDEPDGSPGEVVVADVLNNFAVIDVDLFDLNEVPFSCRDVIYSCVDENSPLLDELLQKAAEESSGAASVASAEYGINNAIPHSKGGELLCPGNPIADGLVKFTIENDNEDFIDDFVVWVGLNNGNGRGSMDAIWNESFFTGDTIVNP